MSEGLVYHLCLDCGHETVSLKITSGTGHPVEGLRWCRNCWLELGKGLRSK